MIALVTPANGSVKCSVMACGLPPRLGAASMIRQSAAPTVTEANQQSNDQRHLRPKKQVKAQRNQQQRPQVNQRQRVEVRNDIDIGQKPYQAHPNLR